MHGLQNTRFYKILHGYHHAHPDKPSHIPPFQYFLVAPIFFAGAYFLNPANVFSYSVGHTLGLGCFEFMHFKIHRVVPPHDEEAYVRYHMHHHRVSHKRANCFTSPFFDIVFGTFPSHHFTYNPVALLPIPYIAFYGVSQVVVFSKSDVQDKTHETGELYKAH